MVMVDRLGLKGEKQGEELWWCWARKIFPVECPVLGRSMAHLDLPNRISPKERAGWPWKGLLDSRLWIHKAPSKAAFSLYVRALLKRCRGLFSATVEPGSRDLMAQCCVLTQMFHTTGKLLEGQAP